MRGRFSLLKNSNGITGSTVIGGALKLVSCSAFSTSSGPGGGGGRGRGSFTPTNYDFVDGSRHPGETDSSEGLNDSDLACPPMGHGHGRGKPLPPPSFVPSRYTFGAAGQPSPQQPGLGRGRGGVTNQQSEPGNRQAEPGNERKSRPNGPTFLRKDETTGKSLVAESVDSVCQPIGLGRGRGGVANQQSEPVNRQAEPGEGGLRPKGPIFLRKDETKGESSVAESVDSVRQPIGEKKLPQSIMTMLSGAGRGNPERKPVYNEKPKEENRHLRTRQDADSRIGRGQKDRIESNEIPSEQKKPKLSREEAVKRAVGILSKDSEREGGGGRRRGKGRDRGRGSRHDDDDDDENEDEKDDTLFMGDDADGEKFANKLGPALMAELTEAFEDLSSEVLPDPVMDEYIEAFDTNLKFELDPESLMGDFENNPDIDENPPIALHDTLEKMKPFLMAYEGIESHEEWEEAVKETMERVPLMKEIVDHYCGPDRVTAKQQHGELERVAKTLPGSAPDAVTRFTDRAVMSLQSNPGWGFDRKCQFMDKLVDEFAKSYK